jgi:hypothetical protein
MFLENLDEWKMSDLLSDLITDGNGSMSTSGSPTEFSAKDLEIVLRSMSRRRDARTDFIFLGELIYHGDISLMIRLHTNSCISGLIGCVAGA